MATSDRKKTKSAKPSVKKAIRAPKSAGAKVEAAKASAPNDRSLRGELVAFDRIVPRYLSNSADEAAAFASLATDARRSELGKQTKAADVLSQSVAVAVAIDAAFRAERATVARHYSVSRFRFLLDAVGELGASLAAPVAGAGRVEATRAAKTLEANAKALKKRLVRAIESFAGEREVEGAALDAAMSAHQGDSDPLASTIGALATLANKWLARKDAKSAVLVAAAGLSSALVDEAMASARAYAEGSAEVALAGRRAGNDSPLVNLKEGAVLVEIIEADRAFSALAEDTNGVIQRLPLGKALRRVARSRPKRAATAEATPAAAKSGEPTK
jgi:hypothetical protein